MVGILGFWEWGANSHTSPSPDTHNMLGDACRKQVNGLVAVRAGDKVLLKELNLVHVW